MTDFEKIDLKRSPEINQKIIQWFDYIINTPNIGSTLEFYGTQNLILYIAEKNGLLRFCGHENHIDHHSSNIHNVIEFICHKMLHDNGKGEVLLDGHSLALARFGFLRTTYTTLYADGPYTHTDVEGYKVKLCKKQVQVLRGILRMIEGKNPGFELNKFEEPLDRSQQVVDEFSKLSWKSMNAYIDFRQIRENGIDSYWHDKLYGQWFRAEKLIA